MGMLAPAVTGNAVREKMEMALGAVSNREAGDLPEICPIQLRLLSRSGLGLACHIGLCLPVSLAWHFNSDPQISQAGVSISPVESLRGVPFRVPSGHAYPKLAP